MIERKQGRINQSILSPLFYAMKIIETGTNIDVCRDPDDNKFIEWAVGAKALYIVSGDNDLLDIKEYDGTEFNGFQYKFNMEFPKKEDK